MKPKSSAAENRSGDRKTVTIQATVSDCEDETQYACLLMDASRTGCRLYCDHVEALPDEVKLYPEGLVEPINASIVWRKAKLAGLAFKWPSSD